MGYKNRKSFYREFRKLLTIYTLIGGNSQLVYVFRHLYEDDKNGQPITRDDLRWLKRALKLKKAKINE